VNYRVSDLRIALHEQIFHGMRQSVSLSQRRGAVQPHVQIEKHVICRAPRADMVAAKDVGDALHNSADLFL